MISAAITTQSPPLTLITPAVSFQTRKPTSTCPSAGGRCPSNALSVFQSIPHFPSTPSPSPTDGGTPALLDSSSIPDFCCERCKTPGCEPGPRTPCRLVILLVLTTFLFFSPLHPRLLHVNYWQNATEDPFPVWGAGGVCTWVVLQMAPADSKRGEIKTNFLIFSL